MSEADFKLGQSTGTWETNSVAAATSILNDRNLRHYDLTGSFQRMADIIGRDFPNIRRIVAIVPLFQHGDTHVLRRRQMAEKLAQAARPLREMTVAECARAADRLCEPGPVEIMSEVVWPMTNRILSVVSGTTRRVDVLPLLDGSPGLNKYRKLDQDIAAGLAELAERFPEETEDQIGVRLASSLIAGQALASTLGVNLLEQLRRADDTPLGALDWSDDFTSTGVLSAERLPANGDPLVLWPGAQPVKSVIADLTCFLTEDPDANRTGMFGLGAHRCLGAGLSQTIWRQLVSQLRGRTARVTFVESPPLPSIGIGLPSIIRIHVANDQL